MSRTWVYLIVRLPTIAGILGGIFLTATDGRFAGWGVVIALLAVVLNSGWSVTFEDA